MNQPVLEMAYARPHLQRPVIDYNLPVNAVHLINYPRHCYCGFLAAVIVPASFLDIQTVAHGGPRTLFTGAVNHDAHRMLSRRGICCAILRDAKSSTCRML